MNNHYIDELLDYIRKLVNEGKLKGSGIQPLLHFIETGEDRSHEVGGIK